jgi:hypothetical protein
MRVPSSQIKIRRPTLQAKKQEYFALVMTVATEVEFKMCSRHRDFFLRYNTPYKGHQTAWNPTTHPPQDSVVILYSVAYKPVAKW